MRLPLRLASAGKGATPLGIIAAMVASTAVFSATPLVLPEVVGGFDVDIGLAGLISGVQLAGFVLTSFFAGRVTHANRPLFVGALVLLAVMNLASVVAPSFAVFVACRFVAGLSLGLIAWLAWAGVFGDAERMGDIAVIGPIAGLVASPVLGMLVDVGSYEVCYLVLAGVSLVPLLRIPDFGDEVGLDHRERSRGGALVAYVLIGCLGLMTMGGSAVFVYSGLIAADDFGMSPFVFSLVLAGNAAAGIPSARYRGERRYPGLWFVLTGLAAASVAISGSALIGSVALVVWGFSYWMGVPATFQLLSERSRFPAERAGDAQAVMAIGRIIGPLVGGALVAGGSFTALGIGAGGAMALAGLVILAIRLLPGEGV